MQYPDAETRIANWLHDHLIPPDGQTYKLWADPRLPQNWPFTAPLGHVQRGPGEADTALTLDSVLLDVDWYAKNADHARSAAELTRSLIRLTLPRFTWTDGVTVSGTATLTAPFWAPDPAVYRRSATYRVILHGMI
jgi:hypothetical protein